MEQIHLNHYYACLTFVAKQRSHDLCGSNGLPLTPNSIKILGRAQYLKALNHPNLFSYIDFLRGKHGRTVVVSEQYGTPLTEFSFKNWLEILNFARDVLKALAYIHKSGIEHRSLSKENIFFSNNSWKLFNYGLFYMTGNGLDVLFPIGYPKYWAPDVILLGPNRRTSGKSDVWSLGIILVELLLDCNIKCGDILDSYQQSLSFINVKDVFYRIAEQCNKCHILKKLPSALVEFVNKMLLYNPMHRPNACDLLKEEIFKVIDYEKKLIWRNSSDIITLQRHSSLELYHYWQLAGGDVYSELKKEGLIRTNPPILTLPSLLLLEGVCYGQKTDDAKIFDGQLVFIVVDHLLKRFSELPFSFPSSTPCKSYMNDMAQLPIAIKERDVDYQFKRIQMFKSIISMLPLSLDKLLKEARQDIPPFLRAEIWSYILKVDDDYLLQYNCIDKETPMPTDRQIEVDIPRCHQYNELLSSSSGHEKFRHILKAWVQNHSEYVYWQGLDSLCAPFLYLNFHNEARAYACLSNFINRYLHNFFLRDNSLVIKEYLAKFRHLIAFLDPILANHLHKIGFSPELFAIPWFLTMFSHVFPIQKILNLWDSLLLGNASFPLFIGFSILQQLRTVLLDSGFNECILLFSDLPEIDIELCVKESLSYCRSTPRSVTYRKHEILDSCDQYIMSGMQFPNLTVEEVNNECSPRISAEEIRRIIFNPLLRARLLLIDIRHPSLFTASSFPGSINIHRSELKYEKHIDTLLSPSSEINAVIHNKGKLVIIIGDNDKEIFEFCSWLVSCGIPKVCILHGGLKALYSKEKCCS